MGKDEKNERMGMRARSTWRYYFSLVFVPLCLLVKSVCLLIFLFRKPGKHFPAENHYNGSAEGHGYPDFQVGEEVDPRPDFMFGSSLFPVGCLYRPT